MKSLETFEQELHIALNRLYDPLYQPPSDFMGVVERALGSRPATLHEALASAIQRIKPSPEANVGSRIWRIYLLLFSRYVQESTQEEVANQLGITARHLRREQQVAVRSLAQSLWNKGNPNTVDMAAPPALHDAQEMYRATQTVSWQQQVQEELDNLRKEDPNAAADVNLVARQAVELVRKSMHQRRIQVEFTPSPVSDGMARLHPSILRQVMIIAMRRLSEAMTEPGADEAEDADRLQRVIRLQVSNPAVERALDSAAPMATVTISGQPLQPETAIESEFARRVVGEAGGQFSVLRKGDACHFVFALPVAPLVDVLVVDDNADLVHMYMRYADQTRFRIRHIADGERIFASIEERKPDLIVLDVMLPNMDGWELLSRLHEQEYYREIPIIICSVVRQPQLARDLGATRYLAKPVHRIDFLRTLDEVATMQRTPYHAGDHRVA